VSAHKDNTYAERCGGN